MLIRKHVGLTPQGRHFTLTWKNSPVYTIYRVARCLADLASYLKPRETILKQHMTDYLLLGRHWDSNWEQLGSFNDWDSEMNKFQTGNVIYQFVSRVVYHFISKMQFNLAVRKVRLEAWWIHTDWMCTIELDLTSIVDQSPSCVLSYNATITVQYRKISTI